MFPSPFLTLEIWLFWHPTKSLEKSLNYMYKLSASFMRNNIHRSCHYTSIAMANTFSPLLVLLLVFSQLISLHAVPVTSKSPITLFLMFIIIIIILFSPSYEMFYCICRNRKPNAWTSSSSSFTEYPHGNNKVDER